MNGEVYRLRIVQKLESFKDKLKSVPANEMHKRFCDFETQIDRLITNRKSELVIINKTKVRNLPNNIFCPSCVPHRDNQRKQ